MATVSQEMKRTPRRPKYSLMMSVIRNTNGQSSTPLVNDNEPVCPNRFQSNVDMPSVGSSANIFTPTNSAISALQTRNAASTTNSRAARESSGAVSAAETPPSGNFCMGVSDQLIRSEAVFQSAASSPKRRAMDGAR